MITDLRFGLKQICTNFFFLQVALFEVRIPTAEDYLSLHLLPIYTIANYGSVI